MRKKTLGLEKKRLTKDWWFLLLTTVSGSSIVDTHRWHRNKEHNATTMKSMRRIINEAKILEIECDYYIEIAKFSYVLTKSLEDNLRK